MSAELQKQHENMDSYDMIEHLRCMFEGQARHKRFDTLKSLHAYKNPTELLAMLKTTETNVQKASPTPMLIVNKGKAKGKGKWKGKRKMGSKSNANPKPDPNKSLKNCREVGHWRREKSTYELAMEQRLLL
ncbi:hypothetical protein AgCh_021938 [Apium graveolens]